MMRNSRKGTIPAAAIAALAGRAVALVLVDLPADAVLKAADAGRSHGLLLFNVGAIDDRLREEDCRGNVVHVAPTRSMLADGLAQYLAWKQWRRWLLIVGSHARGHALWRCAAALRQAVRGKNCSGKGVRGHRRGAPDG